MQYRTIISCILHKNIKNSDKRCTIEGQHFCNNCCYLAETRSKLFRCSVYRFHALKGKTCSKAKALIRRISLSVLPSTNTVMQWPSASLQHFPILVKSNACALFMSLTNHVNYVNTCCYLAETRSEMSLILVESICGYYTIEPRLINIV